MDARSTPIINSDFNMHKNSETSISSEDLLTSSEHLFSAHDTIDLSPDMKQPDKDYVRISKQEYEEIKSRVSAIENRLSREFTDVIPRVQPLQQVQNVYEQTLEEVAMLNYPKSTDNLARRLSKELKIRPEEHAKIIRSPSARKIGSIRRRSKENVTKIVRHKSWNVSSQSQSNADRFYPYVGLTRRERTIAPKPKIVVTKMRSPGWDSTMSENSLNNVSDTSQKYQLRKRNSLAPDYNNLDKPIGRPQRRSLNANINSWDGTASENSMNNTLNCTNKSNNSITRRYQNYKSKQNEQSPSQSQPKWRSAAAFFMDKTGEVDNSSLSGRPSVNKLRKQNAGAVLAKAKLFESSNSDKSSERNDKSAHTGFARRPRISLNSAKPQKNVAYVKPKVHTTEDLPRMTVRPNRNIDVVPSVPSRSFKPNFVHKEKEDVNWRANRKLTPPAKKVDSPQNNTSKTPQQTPVLRKPLCTSRALRTPAPANDLRKGTTPMKAVHVSPRRRSPRQKPLRAYQIN